jgi:type VI secretion system protein ImpB
MAESTQHKLDKIRPPRVQITYDVEIGDAIVKKELPFVVGIMAELSGRTPEEIAAKKPLNERRFVEIDRDNFNDIMASIAPKVKNNGGSITFSSIDDFNPTKIIEQDDALKVLFEQRQRLSDLTARLDGDPALVEELKKLLKDSAAVTELEPLKTKPVTPGTEGGDTDGN